jgi:hypothetical protein
MQMGTQVMQSVRLGVACRSDVYDSRTDRLDEALRHYETAQNLASRARGNIALWIVPLESPPTHRATHAADHDTGL